MSATPVDRFDDSYSAPPAPMDPVSIISTASASARLAKVGWEVGETLFNFAKDAKVVNQSLSALARQARAVKDPCELIDAFLRGIEEELSTQPAWVRTRRGQQLGNVISAIQRQLAGCEETLKELRNTTQDICGEGAARGAGKAWMQFKLNMSKEMMIETRSQLALHMVALNTSLQILNLNKAIIIPGGSTDNVRDSIDALREQISELEQYGTKQPRSEAHQDLLTLAEYTVADGETVYEQSATSGSQAPNSLYVTPQQQDRVATWLHQQVKSHEQPPSFITATTESVSSLNLSEDCTNFGLTAPPQALPKDSSSRQETDLELGLASHKVKRLLHDANVQYNAGNYCKAKKKLEDMLPAIWRLPSNMQNEYDLFDIQYKLSIASYYASEHTNARKVLSEFVRQETSSEDRRLNVAHVSSLLACVYVETRELAAARSSCVKAIQIYRSILGDDLTSVELNLALAARIELLSGNRETAAALLGQISAAHRNQLNNHYAKLPHKQGSTIVERKNIVACEDYLFANAVLSEETGRTEMVTLAALRQSPPAKRSWLKRPRKTTVSVSHTFEPILTQLHIAALFGDVEWATALIADGADVNHACTISTSDCRQLRWKRYHDPLMPITPIACALLLRHMDMVRLLVSRGASLTTWGGSSYAVALLNEAYVADDAYSMEETMRCLKHLGWDIDSLIDVDCSRSRRTMLHHAASVLDTDNVRCLTSCGANVLVKDEADNIPLNLAMKATGSAVTKTMSLLLQHKPQEQLDSRDKDGRTPLHYLMSLDSHVSEDAAWILLRAGANPFLMDRFGNTPYQWFLRNRHHWTEIRAICEEYRLKTPRLDQSDSQPAHLGLQAHATEHLSTAVSDTDYSQSSSTHGLVRPTSI